MGNTCKPMAVSFQCMTKPTTNRKKLKKKTELRERFKLKKKKKRRSKKGRTLLNDSQKSLLKISPHVCLPPDTHCREGLAKLCRYSLRIPPKCLGVTTSPPLPLPSSLLNLLSSAGPSEGEEYKFKFSRFPPAVFSTHDSN